MRAHHVLSDRQKCSNSKRNTTLALKDRIASLRHHRRVGKLLSFDLDNAFDRVRHSFLFDIMCSLGFSRELVALLQIQSSVRQGDPLSIHLFVLPLHPMACSKNSSLTSYN